MAEKEYIDREAAIYVLRERYRIRTHFHDMETAAQLKCAELEIGDIPAADVRPVVYCKDCKHRGNTPDCPFCWLADKKMGDEHFCSFGEKR